MRRNHFAAPVIDLEHQRNERARAAHYLKAKSSGADPGLRVGLAALLAEGCAQHFLDEVAEWSVLYAKELGDS